ncbi:MAG: TRAP transporter small permease subunit [Pseudoalteromonas distincta]
MRAISAFMNGVTRLNDFVGRMVAYLIIPIFAFLILEVFLRYLFNAPTVWTNELTQMLFGAYAVLSGGYILAHRGHVNVDIFHARFGPRMRAVIDIIGSLIFFFFVLAILFFGYQMAQESVSTWETSYSAWNPPIWPVKVAIPVGAALLLLQGIVKLLEDIAIALNLDYYRPEQEETGDKP